MERNVLNRAADYNKKRRKKVRRYKMFTVLAAVVVFCTTYSLIMPAITMETPQCGLEEHTHGSDCYDTKLVCTQEESGHTHGDGCYTVTTTRELTCSQEEGGGHTHDSGCYTIETEEVEKTGTRTETVQTGSTTVVDEVDEEGNVVSSHEEPIYEDQEVPYTYTETVEHEVLTCTEAEGGGHTHDDSCYTEVEHKELTCTEEETGHTHGEECYEKTLVCTLTEHTHDASCYPEKDNEEKPPVEGEEGEEKPPVEGEEGEDKPPVEGEEGEETPPAGTEPTLPSVDKDGYVVDENGDRVTNAEGNEIQYKVDENGELIIKDGQPILAELPELPEELPEEVITVDSEGYLLDENGERVTNADGGFIRYQVDAEGNLIRDENGQPLLAVEEPAEKTLPTVDSEGYLLDENGERVQNEDGSFIQYQVDAEGNLILDADGNPILVEPAAPETRELTFVADSRFFRARFTVQYTGEHQEGDSLSFSAQIDEDQESDLTYDYIAQVVTNEMTTPMGSAQFALTRNGEAVARENYTVDVEIVPSYESVAYLYNIEQGFASAATADERYEDGEETEIPAEAVPGILLYEMTGGEAVEIDCLEFDFTDFDVNSYMEAAGNSTYDNSFTLSASLTGNDFMPVMAVSENPLDILAVVAGGAWRDTLSVLWDGYIPNRNNTSGSHATPDHVKEVYMTHSDSNGIKDSNAPQDVKIWEGTADQSTYSQSYSEEDGGEYTWNGTTIGDKRVNLKQNIYLDATAGSSEGSQWTTDVAYKDSATAVRFTLSNYGGTKWGYPNQTVDGGFINGENVYYRDVKVGDTYRPYYSYGSYTVTKVEYLVSVPEVSAVIDWALLEIEPDPGYYVKQIVIACTNVNAKKPTECSVWSDKAGVFTKTFGVSDGTHVSLAVPSTAFCHATSNSGDSGDRGPYYILIQTAPIPSPLFVSYEPGTIGNTGLTSDSIFSSGNSWLDGNGRNTVAANNVTKATTVDQLQKRKSAEDWSEGELDYYVSGISNVAEAKANAVGYRFTGWRLEYWGDVTKDIKNPYTNVDQIQMVKSKFPTYNTSNEQWNLDNGYGGTIFIPKNEISRSRNLMTNAKLIAQWEPIPVAEIVKTVTGLENSDNTERTFEFTIKSSDNSEFSFTATVPGYKVVNGVPQRITTTQNVTSSNGVATVRFPVRGNDSRSYQISGMAAAENVTYTVTETSTGDFKTTYGTQTFTVNNTGTVTEAQTVTVTNDYAAPQGFELKLVKYAGKDGTDGNGNIVIIPDEEVPLSGAVFEIEEIKNSSKPTSTAEGHKGEAIWNDLEFDTVYTLSEITAPNGYTPLAEPIRFSFDKDGKVTFYDANKQQIIAPSYVAVTEGQFLLKVANVGGYVLPSTGGEGIYWYAWSGALLMMAAAFTLMYKKSYRREGLED